MFKFEQYVWVFLSILLMNTVQQAIAQSSLFKPLEVGFLESIAGENIQVTALGQIDDVLYIGTVNGLFVLDGFNQYKSELNDSLTEGKFITSITTVGSSAWITTFGSGIVLLEKESGRYKIFDKSSSIGSTNCLDSTFKPETKSLLFACDTHLVEIGVNGEIFGSSKVKIKKDGESLKQIVDVDYLDGIGVIVTSKSSGLYLESSSGSYTRFFDVNYLGDKIRLNKLDFDGEGYIYLSSSFGTFVINQFGQVVDHIKPDVIDGVSHNETMKTHFLDLNTILISTFSSGHLRYNSTQKKVMKSDLFINISNDEMMSSSWVVLKTKDHNVIMSTSSYGLVIIPPTWNFLNQVDKNGFRIGTISAISSINDKIFIADGKSLYELINNKLIMRDDDIGYVLDIVYYRGSVILSTIEHGLQVFGENIAGIRLDKTNASLPNISNHEFEALHVTSDDTALIGVNYGDKRGLYRGALETGFKITIPDINVKEIKKLEGEGYLILSTEDGLFLLNEEFSYSPVTPPEYLYMSCIEEIADGEYLICTRGKGIYKFDLHSKIISEYFFSPEMGVRDVRDILKDNNGLVWVATASGLFTLDVKSKRFFKFDKEDGFVNGDYFEKSFLETIDGDVILPGNYDIIRIESDEALRFIKRVENKVYSIDQAKLVVNYTDGHAEEKIIQFFDNQLNNIEIEHNFTSAVFTLNDGGFLNSRTNSFEYLLSGVNKRWQSLAKGKIIQFNSLLPGVYELWLRIVDSRSLVQQPEVVVKITVLPPWWQTWQAYVAYVLLAISLFYLAYWWRLRSLRKHNEFLEDTITERTQTISDLLEQKRTFFANVSHEFRTPLALILGPLGIISNKVRTPELKQQVGIVQRNANRLIALVDQILELAKLETAKTIPTQVYDVKETVDVICHSFESLLQDKRQSLVLTSGVDLKARLLDDSLEKILINLINNAHKYCPEGSTIEVETSLDAGDFRIEVRDDGPGIAHEDIDKIFQRFTRIEQGEDIQGSGIGLALVKELVSSNNGRIEVQSILGAGTNFVIHLPLLDDQSVAVTRVANTNLSALQTSIAHTEPGYGKATSSVLEKGASLEEEETGRQSILIVEDNPDLRAFIQDILSPDFNCILAKDGEEGVKLALSSVPTLILSDVLMPKMDGFALAQKIREEESTSHVPIILLTAKGDDESRMQGWRENVDDFIAKPFNVDELKLRINRILSIREIVKKRLAAEIGNNLLRKNEKPISFQSKRDQAFFSKFEKVIEENYADETFSRGKAASLMAFSERQLNRKLGDMIDYNFAEYLRKYRLQKGRDRILDGGQITEVAFDVGFSSPSYFTSCFKAEFGLSPKEYVQQEVKAKSAP